MKAETSADVHSTPPKEPRKGTDSPSGKSPRNGYIVSEAQDGIAMDKISVGNLYDMKDSSGRWCEGKVVKIDLEGKTVYVQYLYWDSRYDEWISNDRLAPLHTHTYIENGTLKTGQRVEVLDEVKAWREAFIIDESENQVLIHYKGFHTKFDEWIDRSNAARRIRQYGPHKVMPQPAGATAGGAMPIGAQKQWRVPGPLGARINIPGPGRHNSEHKDKMKIKMPGMASSNNNNNNNNSSTTLPPISLKSRSGADGETENDHTGRDLANDNQMTHEENAELRKRRISTLSEQYAQYTHVLAQQGLHIEAVEGDGNCLFRAVAHQIYGDENLHNLVRQKCLDYMESESDFFSQFVEGGREMFPFYLRAKRMDACWGDDPEIEAICELYNRRAEIWAFDSTHGARKLRTFHEGGLAPANSNAHRPSSSSSERGAHRSDPSNFCSNGSLNGTSSSSSSGQQGVIRLSYYGGGHYDSIVNGFHHLDLIRSTPGEVEDANVARASQRRAQARNSSAIEQMTDREATEQATLDLVLQESRNSYLNAGYDDLETCLLLSLQSAPQQHSYYRNGVRADRLPPLLKEGSESDMRSLLSFPGRPASSGSAPAASSQHQRAASSSSSYPRPSSATAGTSGDGQLDGDMDLLAVQGDILRSVQEQSEQDFVDHAILLSSLSETTNAHIATADGSTMAEDTTGVDAYTQRAMELSALSEEEALELALRESLQPLQPTATTAATSSSSRSNHGCHSQQSNGAGNNASGINNDDDFQTEDDLLQAALQASLESHQHRSSSAPSSAAAGAGAAASYSINIGAPYAHMSSGGDDAEDMDEELMRAIEASLQN